MDSPEKTRCLMKILPQVQTCSQCGHEVCARKVSLFNSLSPEELKDVLDLIHRRFVRKGHSVANEGDLSDSLIIVNHGSLKIHSESRDGKEQILYLLLEGDFIGDLNLLKIGTYPYSITTLEDTHLCTIRKPDFDRLIHRNVEIGLKMMAYAHDRISGLEALIQTLTLKDADARLAAFLLGIAEKSPDATAEIPEISLPLSREEIASAIGLTRETVSRKLSQLSSEGIITLLENRKIRISDMNALKDRGELR